MKAVLSVLALAAALAPGLAVAQGCHSEQKVKMSCAEGQAYDAAAKRCSPVVGS
ncbi:MAG: hypothetical protein ACKVPY_14835 [Paracoccaceae bacterium]